MSIVEFENVTRILNDCTVIEHTFSHQAAQYYGSVISTIIIALSLFAFDWRMALASVWVLPVSLLVVRLSKKTQNVFNKRKNDTRVRLEDGVQEAIEALRDLKSTLQKGSELEKRLAEQAKKAGAFTAVKWILISVLSSTVSTLLLHLFLK